MSNHRIHNEQEKKHWKQVTRGFIAILVVLVLGAGSVALIPTLTEHRPDAEEVVVEELNDEEIVDGKDVMSGLIAAEGYVTVRSRCTYCHSSDLIIQNKADYEGWESIIRWMQATQGLPDLGDDEPIILSYLSTNYGPDLNAGRRPPLTDIEWYELD